MAGPSSSPVIRKEIDPFGRPCFSTCRARLGEEAGDAALHVDRAASVHLAVGDLGGEGRMRPGRFVTHRHHIGVAGKHQMRAVARQPRVKVFDVGRAVFRKDRALDIEAQRLQHGLERRQHTALGRRHRRAADEGSEIGGGIDRQTHGWRIIGKCRGCHRDGGALAQPVSANGQQARWTVLRTRRRNRRGLRGGSIGTLSRLRHVGPRDGAARRRDMRTQVAIVGAGPAGLMLGRLLERASVDTIVLERRSASHVLSRIRAGVLEQGSVDLLDRAGVGERVHAEGLSHDGVKLSFDGDAARIDFPSLTGRHVTVYGQTEVTRDLMDARNASAASTVYEAEDVTLHDFDGTRPRVSWRQQGQQQRTRLRFHRGMRRLSRRLARQHSRRCADHLRAPLRFRLAGPAGRKAAGRRRTHLRAPPAWLRALLDALAQPQPLLYPGSSHRTHAGLA